MAQRDTALDRLTKAFEMWFEDWDAHPDQHMADEDFDAQDVHTRATQAAEYLVSLLDQIPVAAGGEEG